MNYPELTQRVLQAKQAAERISSELPTDPQEQGKHVRSERFALKQVLAALRQAEEWTTIAACGATIDGV